MVGCTKPGGFNEMSLNAQLLGVFQSANGRMQLFHVTMNYP
jgi:hypothetical protein